MRLVNFDEFCRMPAGTIFAPYEPCVFRDELAIKVDPGEEMPPTYKWCRHIFDGVMPLTPALGPDQELWNIGDTAKASFEVYDGSSVDYMEYTMFVIFDDEDVDRMINALLWAKNGCKGPANCSVDKAGTDE